jgi:site-specific recombinase XerD
MKNFKNRSVKDSHKKINDLICKFDHYLDLERGLSQPTRDGYCRYISIFLKTNFKSKKVKIKDFRPKDVYRFILSYSQRGKAGSKHMIYALRAFFRFLELFDLANSLPSVSYPRHALPEFLSHEQLQALLRSCDQNTAMGLRDYTILMLLIHLGLRGSEVSKLTLNDFDWDNGEVTIRGKGTITRLPISQELGNALVNYLKRGRPICLCNSFFVGKNQPFSALLPVSIGVIVRLGLQQAGINTKHKGAHLLRHSFATQLLAEGKTLLEIGLALRHKNIRTTAIYAHVDFVKLRLLALPWPIASKGGAS